VTAMSLPLCRGLLPIRQKGSEMSDVAPKIEWLAKVLCLSVGISPTDPTDGSPNWWMFSKDAERIAADLEGRGFSIPAWRDRPGHVRLGGIPTENTAGAESVQDAGKE